MISRITQQEAQSRAGKKFYSSGVSTETVASLVEAISSDKAARIASIAKSSTVLCLTPEWLRAEQVRSIFGIPKNALMALVKKRSIVAAKLDTEKRGSATVYKTESIRRFLDVCALGQQEINSGSRK